jgi:hypothetical protein
MPDVKDYLAMRTVEPKDKMDHGVKGMRWGVRRGKAALRVAAAKRLGGDKAKVTDKHPPKKHVPLQVTLAKKVGGDEAKVVAKPESNIQDHVESSPARYARLAAQARAGQARQMSEQDLKFFNARTDALAKVAKMNEVKPGWLNETVKAVGKTTFQQGLQAVATGVATKYVSGPALEALTGKKGDDAEKTAKAVKDTVEVAKIMTAQAKGNAPKVSVASAPKATTEKTLGMTREQSRAAIQARTGATGKLGMTREQSLEYLRQVPRITPGSSPGRLDLFNELRKQKLID